VDAPRRRSSLRAGKSTRDHTDAKARVVGGSLLASTINHKSRRQASRARLRRVRRNGQQVSRPPKNEVMTGAARTIRRDPARSATTHARASPGCRVESV
jgi:hypothetical protein